MPGWFLRHAVSFLASSQDGQRFRWHQDHLQARWGHEGGEWYIIAILPACLNSWHTVQLSEGFSTGAVMRKVGFSDSSVWKTGLSCQDKPVFHTVQLCINSLSYGERSTRKLKVRMREEQHGIGYTDCMQKEIEKTKVNAHTYSTQPIQGRCRRDAGEFWDIDNGVVRCGLANHSELLHYQCPRTLLHLFWHEDRAQ